MNKGTILASSLKDNTRVELEEVEMDSYGLSLRIDKLYFYLLTSGIGLYLVYQAPPAYSSTSNLNAGDYKGWTGLSPPTSYPSTMGHEANEGSL